MLPEIIKWTLKTKNSILYFKLGKWATLDGEIWVIIMLLGFFLLFFKKNRDVDCIKVKGDEGFIASCAPRVLHDCGFLCLLPVPAMSGEQYKSRNLVSNISAKTQILPVAAVFSLLVILLSELTSFILSYKA